MVSGVRLEDSYIAIRYLHDTENYPIVKLCTVLSINRSSLNIFVQEYQCPRESSSIGNICLGYINLIPSQ